MAEFRVVKQLRDPHTIEVKEAVKRSGRGAFNEDDQTYVVKTAKTYPPGAKLKGTVDDNGFFTPD